MKKIMTGIVLIGLLFSMAAAKSDDKKSAKSTPATAKKTTSFDGWVSDEKCGVKIDAACSKMCHAHGVRLVFVGTDKTIMPVANPDTLNAFIGQHINMEGKLENGVVTVVSVKAAAK